MTPLLQHCHVLLQKLPRRGSSLDSSPTWAIWFGDLSRICVRTSHFTCVSCTVGVRPRDLSHVDCLSSYCTTVLLHASSSFISPSSFISTSICFHPLLTYPSFVALGSLLSFLSSSHSPLVSSSFFMSSLRGACRYILKLYCMVTEGCTSSLG